MFHRQRKDEAASLQAIPQKANRVLHVVLFFLVIIFIRIWHLSVIQHEKLTEEAFRPRRKTIIQQAARGTIRDRFNIPLAVNAIEYRASIIYSQFRDIPAVFIEKDPLGEKKKRFLRKEYIHQLAKKISHILDIDEERLVDFIHSHASLYYHIPLVIKQGLTEEQYYRLKMLSRQWTGLQVQSVPKRIYPRGKAAGDVIGYLGPISKEKYSKIALETRHLSEYLKKRESGLEAHQETLSFAEAKKRLTKLSEMSYTINDTVGLVGIESGFENELRGTSGRQIFFSDAQGNSLRSLPGSRPQAPGKRVLLSLSIELQEFAEKLLCQSEKDRENTFGEQWLKEPLMRGGAIVAMDPNTYEVLALASYPRFDPNDFIRTKPSCFDEETPSEVLRWLQNELFLSKVWNQELPLKRELFSEGYYEEEYVLTWKNFLELVTSLNSPIKQKLASNTRLWHVLELQRTWDRLTAKHPSTHHDLLLDSQELLPWMEGLSTLQEKRLLLDVSYLIFSHEDFYGDFEEKIRELSIEDYRTHCAKALVWLQKVKKDFHKRWEKTFFAEWRKNHEKEFLNSKRAEEKQKNLYAKPYLEYLDQESKQQFAAFWQKHCWQLIEAASTPDILPSVLSKNEAVSFFKSCKGFFDLERPLLVRSSKLKKTKDLIVCALGTYGGGHVRSYAFRHDAIQGSPFKLVTAYAGLKQRFDELQTTLSSRDLALFEITDQTFKDAGKTYLGYFPSGKPIPQLYRGGRIPKSLYPNNGKIDLVRAIETSSNPYFSLLAGDVLKDPELLSNAADCFGFGRKTGIALPGEASGKLPTDLQSNKTGVYSYAIGQHTLLATPLQTAVLLASLANGGKKMPPKITSLLVGKNASCDEVQENGENFPYKSELASIGIGFPLFSQAVLRKSGLEVTKEEKEPFVQLFMPHGIRNTILEGMRRVFIHVGQDRSPMMRALYKDHPEMQDAMKSLSQSMVGKTGTAESQEFIGFEFVGPTVIHNHTWFGGIAFENSLQPLSSSEVLAKDGFSRPELVVVVYLRYGGYGKQAAPLAAQMVTKWRELSQAHRTQPKKK
jgi:cell division protein FtsI/penicillin-binding protein 2